MTFLQNHFFDLERSTLTKMDRCHFNTKYFDYSKQEPATFACDEIAMASGLCIFHDKNYDNDEKLGQKISDKIKSVLAKNEPLFCIGYNIQNIGRAKMMLMILFKYIFVIQYQKFLKKKRENDFWQNIPETPLG